MVHLGLLVGLLLQGVMLEVPLHIFRSPTLKKEVASVSTWQTLAGTAQMGMGIGVLRPQSQVLNMAALTERCWGRHGGPHRHCPPACGQTKPC